jgi:hypothetical protein
LGHSGTDIGLEKQAASPRCRCPACAQIDSRWRGKDVRLLLQEARLGASATPTRHGGASDTSAR